jgi:hypothetical protein
MPRRYSAELTADRNHPAGRWGKLAEMEYMITGFDPFDESGRQSVPLSK